MVKQSYEYTLKFANAGKISLIPATSKTFNLYSLDTDKIITSCC